MDLLLLFYILLFLVAFFYASVGHGGASGYLALMTIFGMAPDVMKPTALLLNLFVSACAFLQFYRADYFNRKLFLSLAILSIPMALLGGLIIIDATVYKKILGVLLLLPIARFFFFSGKDITNLKKFNLPAALIIGAGIGFLSGMIGIGGGIILSPVLLVLRWANIKQTAAISALFIFVNSLSGLSGQLVHGIQFSKEMMLFTLIAFAGGLAGAYFGALRFRPVLLKHILATVLLVAVFKLIFTQA
jgi:uncharacterized membrane protein YfcA